MPTKTPSTPTKTPNMRTKTPSTPTKAPNTPPTTTPSMVTKTTSVPSQSKLRQPEHQVRQQKHQKCHPTIIITELSHKNTNLRCFVARKFLSQIYALFWRTIFKGLKIRWRTKKDKYEV